MCASSLSSASSGSPHERIVLTSFFHWLAATVLALGYPGIVVLMAIESSVLPLPSEPSCRLPAIWRPRAT